VVTAAPSLRETFRSRAPGIVIAALPSIGFVAANAASSLHPAIIVAAGVALAGFAWEVARRRPLWHAAAGLVIVAGCAGVAAQTGQARGFFLLPILVPFSVCAIALGSLAVRKPLTGLVLNRITGGPPHWVDHDRVQRVYVQTTWATVIFQSSSAAAQVLLYRANETVALGVLHLVTGTVSAGIIAVTILSVRRAVRLEAAVGPSRI
jgi:hypothetical protein